MSAGERRVRTGLYGHADLVRMLSPKSIAIVGATPRPLAFGERVLANLAPYQGRVHLVNGRYSEIGERACFASVAALPEVPDCVVIAVPREGVEAVVAESLALGVGGIIVFASGYSETGKPDRAAQQVRLGEMAAEAGIPLVGPNCIGVSDYANQMRITFMPPALVKIPAAGAVGVISQSGALGFALEQSTLRGVSVSHVLTCGNSCDVDIADFVAFLADDPGCKAISLLFEGMGDPMRLVAAAEMALARNKPIVACKIAVGEFGAAAAMSHTGSLAGSQAAYRAAFERAGVVLVDNLEALMETACFFTKVSAPKAAGVAVLATSGGAAIMAADKAEAYGVPLPQPGEAARAVLEARIPEFGSARNPVDVTAQVLTDPESLPACANALLEDPEFGAMVVPNVYASPASIARLPFWSEASRRTGKPVLTVWLTEWLDGPGAHETEAHPDVVLFRSMDRAFASIAAWQRRAVLLDAPARVVERFVADPAPARAMLAAAGPVLSERESKEILALYGIPVVADRVVQSADAAVAAAASMGTAVVLKVESADLPHKTEAGVIRLDLRGEVAVRAGYDAIMAAAGRVVPAPRVAGVLVQPMVPKGVEVMIGARVDKLFGPLVVVGLGGIFVELLKDSAVGLAPLTRGEAMGMLEGLKGVALLRGFRGGPSVDMERLAEIICRVGAFVADHRDIVAEVDINPLICAGSDIVAVDGLIVKAG